MSRSEKDILDLIEHYNNVPCSEVTSFIKREGRGKHWIYGIKNLIIESNETTRRETKVACERKFRRKMSIETGILGIVAGGIIIGTRLYRNYKEKKDDEEKQKKYFEKEETRKNILIRTSNARITAMGDKIYTKRVNLEHSILDDLEDELVNLDEVIKGKMAEAEAELAETEKIKDMDSRLMERDKIIIKLETEVNTRIEMLEEEIENIEEKINKESEETA